ncbi:MAG: hypothetical protein EA396_04755 [Anaerolineaceae bacterium]|nr:MAG: hypothetical protein EA396_04755 [Anaerolineaceae bacterium]
MNNPAEQMKQAIQLIKSGDKRAATAIIADVLQADKTNVDAWFLLANALDDRAKQVKALENALKLNPDYERARRLLDTLQAEPAIDPRLTQAVAMIEEGREREAGKVALAVIKENRKNADAWWVLANAVKAGDDERRIKALEQVVHLRPDHQEAQEWLEELRGLRAPASHDFIDENFDDDDDPFGDVGLYDDDDPFGDVGLYDDDDPFASVDLSDDEDPFADVDLADDEDPFADEAADEPAEPAVRKSAPAQPPALSRMFHIVSFVIVFWLALGAYYLLAQVIGDPGNALDSALGDIVAGLEDAALGFGD